MVRVSRFWKYVFLVKLGRTNEVDAESIDSVNAHARRMVRGIAAHKWMQRRGGHVGN